MTIADHIHTKGTDDASRRLKRIRILVADDRRSAEDLLDAIADVVGEYRASRPVYQKPWG